jgi:hypothetical protein
MKKIYTLLGIAFFTLNAFSTTLVVNNTNDTGSGSLRDAITAASSGDTIVFNSSLAGSTISTSSAITIDKSLVVDGASSGGGSNVTVAGGFTSRLFSVTNGQTVYINNMNFTQGLVTTGGAFLNSGELILAYCRFYNNHSVATNTNHGGGAIYNNTNAYLVINYCEFYDNTASPDPGQIPYGGAIYNRGALVDINYSSFYANKCWSISSGNTYGGAIYHKSGSLNINSSTFSNNDCTAASSFASYGGAISSEDASNIVVKHSTFINNRSISGSNARGGSISNFGSLSIENTILGEGVSSDGKDIFTNPATGISNSLGYNLVQYTSAAFITFLPSDTIAAPDVDTLQYVNGSFTKVCPIRCSSPAVDAGNSASAPATDQIGQTRNIGSTIDIGAFERQSTVNYYTINPMVCDSYTSPSGNYTYTNSAIFKDTTYSSLGCMNEITINLTVNASPNVIASASNTAICEGDTTQINGSGADVYIWNYGLGSGPSKDVTPVADITYIVTGTESSTGCTDTSSVTIYVNSLPAPSINQNVNDLTVTNTYASYQWYFNGNPLVGDTNQTITPSQDGTYMVEVTNSSGCVGTSNFNYTTVGVREITDLGIEVYPNPAQNSLTINNKDYSGVTIINSLGSIVKNSTLVEGNNQLNISDLANGYYILQFTNDNTTVVNQTLIKN